MDWFTQQVWEDLGKPATWEEAQKKLKEKYGDVYEIYNKHDRETNLLKPDGGFSYSNDELKEIGKALEEDNLFVRDKYGIPEDSAINGFIDAIRNRPLENITETSLGGSIDEPFAITEEDVNNMKGRMIVSQSRS